MLLCAAVLWGSNWGESWVIAPQKNGTPYRCVWAHRPEKKWKKVCLHLGARVSGMSSPANRGKSGHRARDQMVGVPHRCTQGHLRWLKELVFDSTLVHSVTSGAEQGDSIGWHPIKLNKQRQHCTKFPINDRHDPLDHVLFPAPGNTFPVARPTIWTKSSANDSGHSCARHCNGRHAMKNDWRFQLKTSQYAIYWVPCAACVASLWPDGGSLVWEV